MTDHAYHTNNAESQANQAAYGVLLEAIKRRMNPDANTVLLIDDERAIRKRVARDIIKSDPEIVIFEAENGQDGLAKLAEIRKKYNNDPVFIVLDLNMPVMTGWEFLERLREDYIARGHSSGIPVIILSSTSGEQGAIPFFRKSVHDGKAKYTPLVTVAKEACVNPAKYDAAGEKGLLNWIHYFMKV